MPDFSGFRAVVTGGGRGIGAAIAAALTRGGAHVTILGRNAPALSARIAAGDAAAYVVADLADRAAFEMVMTDIAAAHAIDILVNNAGVALSAPFLKTKDADFESLFQVNVLGAVTATRAVLPGMVDRKFGRIINIASTAALKGYGYVSPYATSKHALLGFTRALAVEQAVDKIVAKTGRTADSARAEIAKTSPMGRLIAPPEVADAVCFLARRESGGITGTALAVAGGEA
jgi:NAD(P)-dependent dehydrogenase (short-subunit alcohol dehydrogenase family)